MASILHLHYSYLVMCRYIEISDSSDISHVVELYPGLPGSCDGTACGAHANGSPRNPLGIVDGRSRLLHRVAIFNEPGIDAEYFMMSF